MNVTIPDGVFTRADLLEAARREGGFRETWLRNLIASLMEAGDIIRVGHGYYAQATHTLPTWAPPYGETATRVIDALTHEMPLLDFRVWELAWLNEFLNHLVARNAAIVAVESDGCGFAFDVLNDNVGDRVLLRPSPDDYCRYGTDGCIVVMRLVSEAPSVTGEPHRASIEQVLVDVFCDKLLRSALPVGDFPEAMWSMSSLYRVSQPSLFRYARRRGREAELQQYLVYETGVTLYHGKARDD